MCYLITSNCWQNKIQKTVVLMEATLSLSFSYTIMNLPMCANSFYGLWFQWGMGHGKCVSTEFYGQSRNRIQNQMSQTALFLFIVLIPQNWQLLSYHHCPSDRVSCAYPSVLSLPRATWRRHSADMADSAACATPDTAFYSQLSLKLYFSGRRSNT